MTEITLASTLQQALAAHPRGSLCVGFSGGPDSSALLFALAALPEARVRGLRAVHVDHRLHPESGRWADHCQRSCNRIDVPLEICRVRVDDEAGSGPEAAARHARYAAFGSVLRRGECLMTAHHRDDQAETVLLKLFRGAGPEGLGGMRVRRPFANGWLWRPLLDTTPDLLARYLRDHAIETVRDPSNRSTQHARNFLRMEILPQLAPYWPKATQAIAHSARLTRHAADFLRVHSEEALATLQQADDGSLDAEGWLALHPALRGLVLEQWLHAQQLTAPTLAQRQQLQQQIREAADDRVPLVRWQDTAVHVWRGRLYAHPPLPDPPSGWKSAWRGETLHLPAAAGTLRLTATDRNHHASVPTLEVRLGETGIHLRPAGDPHTRELRDLFQQAGIPPWHRNRCPVIYASGGKLLAVADLWQTEAGKALFTILGKQPKWTIGK